MFGSERLDIRDSAWGKWSVGKDVMLQSARGKRVAGVIRDETDSVRGKGSVGRDVILQTVQGGK